MTAITLPSSARPDIQRRRRLIAIVALVLALLAGSITVTTVAGDAGAMPNGAACVMGGLAGVGTVGLLVAFPPAGLFEVVTNAAVNLTAVISIADACGSWWTTDLSDVIHFYGYAGGGGGGGSW